MLPQLKSPTATPTQVEEAYDIRTQFEKEWRITKNRLQCIGTSASHEQFDQCLHEASQIEYLANRLAAATDHSGKQQQQQQHGYQGPKLPLSSSPPMHWLANKITQARANPRWIQTLANTIAAHRINYKPSEQKDVSAYPNKAGDKWTGPVAEHPWREAALSLYNTGLQQCIRFTRERTGQDLKLMCKVSLLADIEEAWHVASSIVADSSASSSSSSCSSSASASFPSSSVTTATSANSTPKRH